MGKLVRVIGSGVGLVAEAVTSARQPKEGLVHVPDERADELIAKGQAVPADKKLRSRSASPAGSDHSDASDASDASDLSDMSGVDEDEEQWALDEASEELSPQKSNSVPERKLGLDGQATVKSLEEIVLAQVPPPPASSPPLPAPVILPQRRPGNVMGRGFIRAYAPDLADKGIPEEVFLSFVKCLSHTNKANPILSVVFFGAAVAGFAPNMVIGAASMAVQVVVGAAIIQQKRARARTYLDEMNDKLFKPRGLYAVVMSYSPTQKRPVETKQVDMNTFVANRDGQKKRMIFPKVVSGETYGEMELPESAPLVFPSLDKLNPADQNKLKAGKKFVSDYNDRRAQIEYMRKHPDSQYLSLPEHQAPAFATSLADPNHPAFRGSFITLFSGGKIPPIKNPEKKAEKKRLKRERKGKAPGRREKKKLMKENVLYLMVVNFPTEEELELARKALASEELEEAQERKNRVAAEAGLDRELGPPPKYDG